jgi:hypothetical protein
MAFEHCKTYVTKNNANNLQKLPVQKYCRVDMLVVDSLVKKNVCRVLTRNALHQTMSYWAKKVMTIVQFAMSKL